jgi:hypothetical protein
LEKLRKTTLELVKKIPQRSGIKGMGVFTTYKLEDKVQELIFWSSGIEQNSPHTQEV